MSKKRKWSAAQKTRVLNKTSGCCAYCGTPLSLETVCMEHLIPQSRGGLSSDDNLYAACRPCNTAKGVFSLEQYRLACLHRPLKDQLGFSIAQLEWLRDQGFLLQLDGGPKTYQFFFEELSGQEVAACNTPS